MENKTKRAMSLLVLTLTVFGLAAVTTTAFAPTAAAGKIGAVGFYNNCQWDTGGVPPVGCAGNLEIDP